MGGETLGLVWTAGPAGIIVGVIVWFFTNNLVVAGIWAILATAIVGQRVYHDLVKKNEPDGPASIQ